LAEFDDALSRATGIALVSDTEAAKKEWVEEKENPLTGETLTIRIGTERSRFFTGKIVRIDRFCSRRSQEDGGDDNLQQQQQIAQVWSGDQCQKFKDYGSLIYVGPSCDDPKGTFQDDTRDWRATLNVS
jgi:hypothetical protein